LIASTGFVVLTPKLVPPAFLLFSTTTPDFVGYLENHAKGAAYPAVVAGDFERASVCVPNASILHAFSEFVEPLFDQMYNLKQQNQKLRAARDLLLPRLMNGEVVV
jgi:type I restriction enzyme S subunit